MWLEVRSKGEPDEVIRCRRRIDAPEQARETVRSDPFIAMFGFHDDLERRRAMWAHLHPAGAKRKILHSEAPATAIDMTTCPDCGYGLTGVPSAIPTERIGLDVGPSACPECGCAWPLVPPPV